MPDRDTITYWWPYIAIIAVTILLGAVLVNFDTFEALHEFTRSHEDWELDELIPLALASVFGLVAALIVRSVQLRRQIAWRVKLEEEANSLARHDALTGLANRRHFVERANMTIARAAPAQSKLAVLAIDLDRFKPINDIYGHGAGDKVLQTVSDRLLGELPAGPLASRMGGDEFAVLMPVDAEEDTHGLERLARRICQKVAEPLHIDGLEFSVTASIGIALFPTDGSDIQTLLTHADMAMYAAKASGRNNFAYFEPKLGEAHRKRYELESELSGAIAGKQIVPYLQPVFDLGTGKLTGFEILSRWDHPVRGVLLPEEFIPLAEDSGQITALTESVLRQACDVVAAWHPTLRYSLNLSPVQFYERRLVDKIVRILEETGMPAGSLEVEITEAVFIEDEERARTVIHALRQNGIAVALDDFGKGYSSLSYLSRFEIDKLKIDRAFIAGRHADERNAKVVNSVIQLGLSLGIETTAEGVQTGEDASWLAERGCAQAQGFHYSKPMPVMTAFGFFERYANHPFGESEASPEPLSSSNS